MQHKFKMNLQFFAESGGEPGQQSQPEGGQTGGSPQTPPQEPQIDYNKIQQMLDGTLAAKENTALKAYFKQQKAANTPDIEAIQNQVQTAQKMGTASHDRGYGRAWRCRRRCNTWNAL